MNNICRSSLKRRALLITALIYDVCILAVASIVRAVLFCGSLIHSGLKDITDNFNYLWASVSRDMKKVDEKEEDMWNSR